MISRAGRIYSPRARIPRVRGMSFTEVLVVLGALAVLVGILIPSIVNVVPNSRQSTAQANLEQLNKAVLKFNQINWDLVLAADAGSSDDEQAIFRSLQYRDTANPAPGSPYLEPTLTFVATEDDGVHRAAWNGRMFELIPVGTAGTGLDLSEMLSGSREPVSFEEGFEPVGAP